MIIFRVQVLTNNGGFMFSKTNHLQIAPAAVEANEIYYFNSKMFGVGNTKVVITKQHSENRRLEIVKYINKEEAPYNIRPQKVNSGEYYSSYYEKV